MRKHVLLSLLFLLMFALSLGSINAVPQYSNEGEKYANLTSEYTYQRNFGFQMDWVNGTASDNADIQNVTFELTRVDGTPTNYTEFTTIAISNSSQTYYINFTQEQLGRASNSTDCYSVKWYANCTDNAWNSSSAKSWCLNKSTETETYMNVSRREYPDGTIYQAHTSGVNLSYSSPISQNITGWYGSRFDGQTVTFTLYRDSTSIGTSNPQSSTRDYTDQSDTWIYNTSGNNNYTSGSKTFTVTYVGGSGGGGGGTAPPPSNIPCPYECCQDESEYMDKLCADGECINHNCIVGATTTVRTVTTIPSGYTFELPILGEVEMGMNLKFLGVMFGGLIFLVLIIGLFAIAVKG